MELFDILFWMGTALILAFMWKKAKEMTRRSDEQNRKGGGGGSLGEREDQEPPMK